MSRHLTKKHVSFLFLAHVLILTNSGITSAQNTGQLSESIQEFFKGETVYAQNKNEIQITTKPSYWKKADIDLIDIPLQIEYGFTDRLQIELCLPYDYIRFKGDEKTNGLGNVEIGLLYNLLNRNKPFALSLALGMGLPTAQKAKNPEEVQTEWEPSLIIARQAGKAQFHASLGAEITETEFTFNYHFGAIMALGDWRTTLELSEKKDNEGQLYITPGIIWKRVEDFEFGVGISKSITGQPRQLGFMVMITHEFSL
jgi:Putative MetA-pathway of phenol degradation